MILTKKDKEILKKGDFIECNYLLLHHFHDQNDKWIKEANKFFEESHPKAFKRKKQ